jgi:uncharacterized SAM-binding protein YcdF (DUF218 family)
MDKLAIALISPLGTAMAVGALALGLAWLAHRRWAWWAGLLALLWLGLWSMPAVSMWLRAQIEVSYPPQPMDQVPQAEALVVLGGAMSAPTARRPYADLNASADRLWHAARLYHAGKVRLLVLSGGSGTAPGAVSEAEAMRLFLRDLGVPEAAMLLEQHSGNTRQNASLSAEILAQRGITRILLVTSALHMARARANFEAAGLSVVPVATDHESLGDPPSNAYLPSAEALNDSGLAMKEWIGQRIWTMRAAAPPDTTKAEGPIR